MYDRTLLSPLAAILLSACAAAMPGYTPDKPMFGWRHLSAERDREQTRLQAATTAKELRPDAYGCIVMQTGSGTRRSGRCKLLPRQEIEHFILGAL
jgi:hypothetical protein